MVDWLARNSFRLPIFLAAYFVLHAVARVSISPSLDFDESEQLYLSQWIRLGYNSQPPLYTWIQIGLFELFGYSVVSLALLKNTLLALTYYCVYDAAKLVTKDTRLAIIASLGMLTIPQIAWESHRDLSHTVAVTFTTAWLFQCVVRLVYRPNTFRYLVLGLAIGSGLLFKYNFAIVVVGFLFAAASLPSFRTRLLDRRLILTALIAGVMLLPHAMWMLSHPDLVSGKTIATLTNNESRHWHLNLIRGFAALSGSTFSCCGLTLASFGLLYARWGRCHRAAADDPNVREATIFLERFLLATALILVCMVFSGHAVEFKNRWLQPFVCLLPSYLTFKYSVLISENRRAMNLGGVLSTATMLVVLVTVVIRPMVQGTRSGPNRLNIPYDRVAAELEVLAGEDPSLIVASNMRLAGNLRTHFPNSRIFAFGSISGARYAEQLAGNRLSDASVVIVTDKNSPAGLSDLNRFTDHVVGSRTLGGTAWTQISVPYSHTRNPETKRFYVCTRQLHASSQVAAATALSSHSGHR